MSTPSEAVGLVERPIQTSSYHGVQVVHGAYGLVHTNGQQFDHLTMTWVGGTTTWVTITLTNPRSGYPRTWIMPRYLLRDGGTLRSSKVDHAGELTFLVQGIWVSLNRAWVARFIETTEHIYPIAPSPL